MKIPTDPQFPGPSENIEGHPDAPEPAAEGDIQIEYSSEQLYGPSILPVRTQVTIDTV